MLKSTILPKGCSITILYSLLGGGAIARGILAVVRCSGRRVCWGVYYDFILGVPLNEHEVLCIENGRMGSAARFR